MQYSQDDINALITQAPLSLDLTTIIISIVFSIIGYAAWRHGRKNQSGRHMILAVGLMGFGYFISTPWIAISVGIGLTILLFWP